MTLSEIEYQDLRSDLQQVLAGMRSLQKALEQQGQGFFAKLAEEAAFEIQQVLGSYWK